MAQTMVLFDSSTNAAKLMEVLDAMSIKYTTVETTERSQIDVLLKAADFWREQAMKYAEALDRATLGRNR